MRNAKVKPVNYTWNFYCPKPQWFYQGLKAQHCWGHSFFTNKMMVLPSNCSLFRSLLCFFSSDSNFWTMAFFCSSVRPFVAVEMKMSSSAISQRLAPATLMGHSSESLVSSRAFWIWRASWFNAAATSAAHLFCTASSRACWSFSFFVHYCFFPNFFVAYQCL